MGFNEEKLLVSIELGIVCWSSKINLKIRLFIGRNFIFLVVRIIVIFMSGIMRSCVVMMVMVVCSLSFEVFVFIIRVINCLYEY